VIGVLGTDATVPPPYVDNLPPNSPPIAPCCVTAQPGLSSLRRPSCAGKRPTRREYRAILAGLLDQPGGDRMDTVVLACTHFPLVADELRAAAPRPSPSSTAATASRGESAG
jgi:glutamate racemase